MTEQSSERLPGRTPESRPDVGQSQPQKAQTEPELTRPAPEPKQTTGVKRTRKKRAATHRLEHAFRKFREGPGREAQDLYRRRRRGDATTTC